MLKLAALFGDNAVLQRDRAIPVWGWCAPYRRVRATLGNAICETRSGADGQFLFRFSAMSAATGLTLQVRELESDETVTAQNIAVGEVWLASGQSNMEFKVLSLADEGAEVRKLADDGEYTGVRMLTVPHIALLTPAQDVEAEWQCATGATIDTWSAIGLFFARKLNRELGVTVGILSSNWGGTIAEAWTSRETLARNPELAPLQEKYEQNINRPQYWDQLTPEQLAIPPTQGEPIRFDLLPPEPPNTGYPSGWANTNFDDSEWSRATMPSMWSSFGVLTHGTLWFRRKVEIPGEWAGRDLILSLGGIDKHDITYFDGVEVGRMGKGFETACWNVCRVYRIPGKLVKPGVRVISVRNYCFVYDAGLIGPSPMMKLHPVGAERDFVPLTGEWAWKIETDLGPATVESSAAGLGNPNSYSILYDNMIHPFRPTALRGFLWYQGESNASRFLQYERIMRDLIADWRFRFGQGDVPFLQVVLAGFRQPGDYDATSTWAPIREAQCRAAAATGNFVASAVDVGEENDIHPKDKQTVGERLAAAALAQAYDGKQEGSGPLFHAMSRSGDTLLLEFTHVADGLTAENDKPLGFRIAGKDQVFRPADAVIVGGKIALSSPNVPEPLAACYAWADNPDTANLYNSAGLPALPFRAGDFGDAE